MRGMVTGDHRLSEAASEQAEQVHAEAAAKIDTCEFGWYVQRENEGHICRLPKGHPPPHRCTLNTRCQAKYAE